MGTKEKYTKTIMLRIDPELLELMNKEVQRLNTDRSSYIRWCIRTGIYLEDLNKYFSSDENEAKE